MHSLTTGEQHEATEGFIPTERSSLPARAASADAFPVRAGEHEATGGFIPTERPITYAVISDVHGNKFALEAVLADAKVRGAEHYLFLGDYFQDLPFGNEVCELIRSVPGTVIRGNKEARIAGWRDEIGSPMQVALIRNGANRLTPENYAFLTTLPETAAVTAEDGAELHLEHAPPVVFDFKPRIETFRSGVFRKGGGHRGMTVEEYTACVLREIDSRPDFPAALDSLPYETLLFGHNHVQLRLEIGGRLLLNPGSAGMSLDGDNRAAYALIDRSGGRWNAEPRRVGYDVDSAIAAALAYADEIQAGAWGKVHAAQLKYGYSFTGAFMRHVNSYIGIDRAGFNPVSDEIFAAASDTFDINDYC
ncbi:MAG: metallophosphatase family protein [Oscillospiraceae bacterium]|jgi:predicted phosphodiesterase|nr:metallophosphatase family protein [Oscillospiraceae bacterium]